MIFNDRVFHACRGEFENFIQYKQRLQFALSFIRASQSKQSSVFRLVINLFPQSLQFTRCNNDGFLVVCNELVIDGKIMASCGHIFAQFEQR